MFRYGSWQTDFLPLYLLGNDYVLPIRFPQQREGRNKNSLGVDSPFMPFQVCVCLSLYGALRVERSLRTFPVVRGESACKLIGSSLAQSVPWASDTYTVTFHSARFILYSWRLRKCAE